MPERTPADTGGTAFLRGDSRGVSDGFGFGIGIGIGDRGGIDDRHAIGDRDGVAVLSGRARVGRWPTAWRAPVAVLVPPGGVSELKV